MESLPYLDIHTHRRESYPSSVNVACLSTQEILQERCPKEYATAGIHPWWLEDLDSEQLKALKAHITVLAQKKKLWAIGETGIDRGYPELLDQQRELFSWHMELSEQHNLPLIIHSVKAGSDFLHILKEQKPNSPWIFHDFRGNQTLVRDLLKLHPECYFSFGLSIDNSPTIRELLPLVPLDKIFLETDDQKHLDIHEIYLRASHHLQMDPEFLKSQIWLNFKKITNSDN